MKSLAKVLAKFSPAKITTFTVVKSCVCGDAGDKNHGTKYEGYVPYEPYVTTVVTWNNCTSIFVSADLMNMRRESLAFTKQVSPMVSKKQIKFISLGIA